MKFLKQNNLLCDRQYGFRKNRSTTDAITDFIGDVIKKLDDKQSVHAVMIDLSKAFDVLVHDILLSKLEYYGIRGVANNLV